MPRTTPTWDRMSPSERARAYRLSWLLNKRAGIDQPPWIGSDEPDMAELNEPFRFDDGTIWDDHFRIDGVPEIRRPAEPAYVDAPDCPLGCVRHPAWL